MRNFLLTSVLLFSVFSIHGQTYFLNGSAVHTGGDCYLLTPMLSNMNGTVWYADQIDLQQPFDLQFTMNFGTLDANGADGMCFVLQTVGTNAIGVSGGGMGYQSFGTSLGIEFDTYQNGNFGDPSYDHIGIQTNGNINHGASTGYVAGPVQASSTNVNIEDGQDHVVRVRWNPETHIVQVYFDCVFRLEGEIDLINTIFGGESLVYWGFTAATGGSINNQSVCLSEDILNVSEVSVCAGASVQLDISGAIDGIYSWTPTDYLDNPNIATPTATPPSTMVYTATYTDICGTLTETEVTVNVEELEVEIENSVVLSCIVPDIDLQAEINMELDGIYTWTLNDEQISSGNNLNEIEIDEPGTYTVEVNIDNQCFADFTIEVEGNYSTYEINAGADQALNCNNEEVTITVQTNGASNLIWTYNNEPMSNENGLSVTVDDPGTYIATAAHPVSGCHSEDTVVVTEDYATAQINTGEQDSLSCIKSSIAIQNIQITSVHEYTIQWSTLVGNITDGGNTAAPVVNAAGDYTITVTDNETGCASTATVLVGETEDFGFDVNQLIFPNIITPNSDAYNTNWSPFSSVNPTMDISKVFSHFDLKIYDRWGKTVFESTQFSNQWDAKELGEGTYFYILQFESYCSPGSTREVHGNIYVARK